MSSNNAKFEMLFLNNIELDLKNPRIARLIEMYGEEVTAEQISLALESGAGRSASETGGSGSSTTYISLKESIKTNGGIIHPIIVNRDILGKLTVIEGNTRVQIYREFKSNSIQGFWDAIPAMVYENLDQAKIDAIRLQAHLVGPREWDPYSKAKYLNYLSNEENLTLAQIVDFCGGNKTEVNSYINAYVDMEKFYRPLLDEEEVFDHRKFSAFVELQKIAVKSALANHNFSKTDFSKWIIDDKIGRLENVRAIPRVLNNPKSKELFLRENLEEAKKALDVTAPNASLGDATLEQLAHEISKKIASVTWSYVQKLKSNPSGEAREIIFNARDTINDFCKDIEIED